MKRFPAKISELATLQKSMTSEGNHALLLANRRSVYFPDILYDCIHPLRIQKHN